MKITDTIGDSFAETPLGIFTVNGNWFYTNSDEIERFAPGLLQKISLKRLVSTAEIWVSSTDSVSVLILVLLLLVLPGYMAVLLSIMAMIFWHLMKSAVIGRITTVFVKVMSFDPLVLLLAVLSLSYLGVHEEYTSLGYGLLFFILFRFGWLRKGFDQMYIRVNEGISLNDRVMKMVIVRQALNEDITIRQIQQMENQIRELMQKRRPKDHSRKKQKR
jgi:hypothetical protein